MVNFKPAVALLLVSTLLASVALFAPAYGSTGEWKTHYVVDGFINSGPPDPHQVFKIHYRVLNGTVEQFSMPYVGYAHYIQADVHADGNGTLDIRFPRNYPSSNYGGYAEAIFFLNEQEIYPESLDESHCFYEYSIMFSDSAIIDVVWTDLLTGEPFRGVDVPDGCISETLVQDVNTTKYGTIAPLHQLKTGVKPDEVACGDEHELVVHPNGKPYCVRPSSAGILKERWDIR